MRSTFISITKLLVVVVVSTIHIPDCTFNELYLFWGRVGSLWCSAILISCVKFLLRFRVLDGFGRLVKWNQFNNYLGWYIDVNYFIKADFLRGHCLLSGRKRWKWAPERDNCCNCLPGGIPCVGVALAAQKVCRCRWMRFWIRWRAMLGSVACNAVDAVFGFEGGAWRCSRICETVWIARDCSGDVCFS